MGRDGHADPDGDADTRVSRRVLVVGLSTPWGGRLAQRLEREPQIEAIVGTDSADPRHELARTEFVRVDTDEALLRRIIQAARIDTVVDVRLVPDGRETSERRARQVNVDGTRCVLRAAAGEDGPVRKLVFKSAAEVYGADRDDPAFFTEEMRRTQPPSLPVDRHVVDAEGLLAAFARAHPRTVVTRLRCAAIIGPGLRSSELSLLGLPAIPSILGFDPRWQFVHADDVLGGLRHAVLHELPGAYNVAADGVLALSEVASLLGKPLLPVLPPWGTVFAAIQLRRLGLPVPVAVLRDLRHGRGLDNRRLKATGFQYRHTSREAIIELRAQQRLRPLLEAGEGGFRYEREVEAFLRWSPSVQAALPPAGERADELGEAELLEVIPSLEPEAIRALRAHEAAGQARPRLLAALDRELELRGGVGAG